MKPQETTPLLTTLAPAALLTPPVAIFGLVLAVGLFWLLSGEEEPEKTTAEAEKPSPETPPIEQPKADAPQLSRPTAAAKRVTREDLAEALAYGERRLSRKEAVSALEALGIRKSAAYKALAETGKFASLIEFTPDGLVEWKG